MKHRSSTPTAALAFALAAGLFALSADAQSRAVSPKKWTTPRTPDGQPDLQGIWTNATITPFERPRELAGKEYFTEQEAAEYEKKVVAANDRDRRSTDPIADVGGAYNEFWFDRGTKVVPTRRTSIVVDPADGRVPPLTPAAQKAATARAAIARRLPEARRTSPRLCDALYGPRRGRPCFPLPTTTTTRFCKDRDT
jgi:hypothetical protein